MHDTQPQWFAIFTNARCEKLVLKFLQKKEIHAYLPIGRKIQRWGRVVRKVEKPLINGYVFVKIIKKEYVPVLETPYVAGFLKIGKELHAIPEPQIELLKRLAGEDDLEIETLENKTNLTIGAQVEIIKGNLAGMKGQLIEIQGKRKFLIELTGFPHDLIMTIDPAMLMILE